MDCSGEGRGGGEAGGFFGGGEGGASAGSPEGGGTWGPAGGVCAVAAAAMCSCFAGMMMWTVQVREGGGAVERMCVYWSEQRGVLGDGDG